jgi:nucleotide-binding universal stress UspA family protein
MTTASAIGNGPILVAVDFSEGSRSALLWAARQAQLENTDLHILHVVHDPAASPGFYRKPEQNWLRPMVDVAEEMLEEFLRAAKAERADLKALATAEPRLVTGLPAGRIVEVAREIDARMIVVGSLGRSGVDAILLGSIAERVAQLSPVPVTIVPIGKEVG